jgi:fibronectin type 3 domain-containing protein
VPNESIKLPVDESVEARRLVGAAPSQAAKGPGYVAGRRNPADQQALSPRRSEALPARQVHPTQVAAGVRLTRESFLGDDFQIPAVPAGPVVTAVSASRISLAWAASPGASGYAVFRSPDGSTGWAQLATIDAPQTSFTDDRVRPGTTYYYRVAATSPAGNSPLSAMAVDTTAPASPTNVIAIARSASTAVVSWSSFGGESGFSVMVSSDGGAHYRPVGMTGPEANSFEVTGLLAATAYLFEVIARNATGPSAPSGPAAATTAPAAPGSVRSVAVSPGDVDIFWARSAGATGYEVQRSSDGFCFADLARIAGAVTRYADRAAAAGTRYWYRVVAVNDGSASLPSTPADATTPASSPLGLVARTVSFTEIQLSWDALPQATRYDVQISIDGHPVANFGPAPAGTDAFSASGLMPGVRYAFRVVAAGEDFQVCGMVVARTANEAPTNVAAVPISASRISIVWSFVTGAAGYTVERSPDGTAGWASVGSTAAGTTQLIDITVAARTQYFYRVLATDAGGISAPSDIVAAMTPPQPPVPTADDFSNK